MFTTQHYKTVAEAINKSVSVSDSLREGSEYASGHFEGVYHVACMLALEFKADNDRFKADRFWQACGLIGTDNPIEG